MTRFSKSTNTATWAVPSGSTPYTVSHPRRWPRVRRAYPARGPGAGDGRGDRPGQLSESAVGAVVMMVMAEMAGRGQHDQRDDSDPQPGGEEPDRVRERDR